MTKTIFAFAVLLASLASWAPAARADAPTTSTFALVVTNNRSVRLSRPDLRYADDDGAKYYELFRMLAPESNVALLTTFDRDTQKLFPHLVGKEKPPSKVEVRRVTNDFIEKVNAAKLRGPVDFFFVFAGHGDIDQGKGFLELSDGVLTSDDLEALLTAIPATRSHVILDSCNSFFVINSRKPGGRHFVTSEEATKSLSARLPNVGVFLSTSAEAEVFEWSELQSGVFSHAVRSGLSGAADANGDGQISYDELRAFVDVATKDVKNPNYRPQVFARGPGGRGGDTLVDLTKARAARVRIDGAQRRLTVRDQDEVPWVDLHKEAGAELMLRLPLRMAASGSLDEADVATGAVVRRYRLKNEDASNDAALAQLDAGDATQSTRGPDDMFRVLFSRPFGASAYAQFRAEEAKSEPLVLGVSADERERMRLLLRESADSARGRRLLYGPAEVVLGAGLAAASAPLLVNGIREHNTGAAVVGGVLVGGGAFVGGEGLAYTLQTTFEEQTYETFTRSLRLATNTVQAQGWYALAEQRLLSAAERDRRNRLFSRWISFADFVFGAGMMAGLIVDTHGDLSKPPPALLAFDVVAMMVGGFGFADSLFPTTTERMAALWKSDPGLLRSRMTSGIKVKPVFAGPYVGLKGTF